VPQKHIVKDYSSKYSCHNSQHKITQNITSSAYSRLIINL